MIKKEVPGFVGQISFSLFPTNGTFRCVLETTLADLLLMGAPYEWELCFANNVPVFSLHINIAKITSVVPVSIYFEDKV